MLDLAGRPLDLAAEVHTRGSEDLQVMDGIHHTPLFSWFRSIKHLRTLQKMLRNMKFGSVVHELFSEIMAINGGSTQKYEQIGP